MKRVERLNKPRQYAAVYAGGGTWASRLIVMRAVRNNLNLSRYGLSVSKKVGNAVIRNRIKRRLREIMRGEPLDTGWDVVLIARPAAAETSFSALRESVETLLLRAEILETEKEERPAPER